MVAARRILRWLALTALIAPALAVAEPASEPVRIVYSAPEGCADRAAFLAQVAARASRLRLATEGELARRVDVSVTRGPEGARGHLAITEADGRVTTREVEPGSCDEVVAAMVLITALAIDAQPAPEAPPPASAPPLPPAAPKALPPPAPVPAAAQPLHPARPRPARKRAPRHELGVGIGMTSGIAPELAPGAALFFGMGPGDGAWSARASAMAWRSLTAVVGPGEARFEALALRLAGCGRVAHAELLEIAACASVDAGALRGAGAEEGRITAPETATIPWLAAGPGARADVSLGAAFLELDATLGFPLVRRTFVFEQPDAQIHKIPPVYASVVLGGGGRF